MKASTSLIWAATAAMLAACSAPQPSETAGVERAPAAASAPAQPAASADATGNTQSTPATDAATTQATGSPAATPPADTMSNAGQQAGWYTAGTFRACGSTAALKVGKSDDIDRQIREGGMSASDPVYVRLEGMPMSGDTYMVTRVVQVGSKTPVRDCPMSGTTTQVGG